MAEPSLNDDFKDVLQALIESEAHFVIVGAHAMAVHGVARATGDVGLPPRRIDLLTSVSGVTFERAWRERRTVVVDTLELPFLGLSALRANKQATGRPKDLADLVLLNDLPDG
ncbi:MAG: hypothetical protein ACI81R_002486 [Bradymonadia bacterium]|jgi:hypothetical protein